ncbi:MAG: hypothetical protein RLZZ297_1266, partial [Chloroflexota bacterium]
MSKETLDNQTTGGRSYWRSLEDLTQSSEFQARLQREFPREAAELRDPVSRRSFLKLMGASMALSTLAGCQFAIKQPQEVIVPYVRQPEAVIPGRSLYFATSMNIQGYGVGLLAESHEGRPTKVEGNPDHSASMGASDAWIQASVLTMYDPDRSQQVRKGGQPATWADAAAALAAAAGSAGAGIRVISEPNASPTLGATVVALATKYPGTQWIQYDALSNDNAATGAAQAFGAPTDLVYSFDAAEVVVALDSDFTHDGPAAIRYARDFASKRRITSAKPSMSRLYAAEPTPSHTGTMADHRLAAKAGDIAALTDAIAAGVGVAGVSAPQLDAKATAWVKAAVADLKANAGKSIVITGETQSAAQHALVVAINNALGKIGKTVKTIAAVNPVSTGVAALKDLVAEMNAGAVKLLVISDANIVYNAPADLKIAEALAKVETVVHHGLYADESATNAAWHINGAHYLESWGDSRAFDGTVTIQQPLIAPLYDGKTLIEVLNALMGVAASGHETVKGYWKNLLGTDGYAFDKEWQITLHDGVIKNTASPAAAVSVTGAIKSTAGAASEELELVFRADSSLRDGSASNNGWLQEVPKLVTKLTWDNAAQLSPATAAKLGVQNTDVVKLSYQDRVVNAPVWIVPGQADNTVVVHFGFGRGKEVGRVGENVGFNAYTLRGSDSPWHGTGVTVTKTGETYKLATTQKHVELEGRDEDIYPVKTLHDILHPGEHGEHKKHEVISLFPEFDYSKGYQWGMQIDLNACNGCNACVVACQAENNIPIVGKTEILIGREMHWIRIDTYFSGDAESPSIYQQPVACMQCEHAPCEIVCPVAATVHDDEGLNVMVYNRCVGTKYCSNNCPYKVRRFNFFQYVDDETPSLKLQRNPDVTVRARGVMEKCNYCVQRINEARIDADRENRQIVDGEVVSACQQACPSQAIVFGNINDAAARVSQLKALETK